jgi:transcriptional regulator with XRE-family HTH domain
MMNGRATPPRTAELHTQLTSVGEVIRTARRGRYSVEQLATRAGVSSGLISQIERGLGNPSLAALLRLAQALGISPHDLVERPPGRQTAVVRRGGRRVYGLVSGDELLELLVPNLHRTVVITRAVVPPGWNNRASPFEAYHGDAVVHLLAGQLIVFVGQPIALREGDTLTLTPGPLPFRAWWENPGIEPAEVINVYIPEGMR